LRWRIFARMRRFLRPSFRRPLPDFLVPKAISVFKFDRFVPTNFDAAEHVIVSSNRDGMQ
jgi:hypothetical protein